MAHWHRRCLRKVGIAFQSAHHRTARPADPASTTTTGSFQGLLRSSEIIVPQRTAQLAATS